jgi:hydroxymethylglutaryl-CoA synthase
VPGIHSIGVAIPLGRLPRGVDAVAWGSTTRPGERAVAGADEDALTLAVDAGGHALQAADGFARSEIGLIVFATTTSPYNEKLGAAIAALALDLRDDVRSIDVTDSVRAGLDALQIASDAVTANGAAALVLAADCRAAEPGSPGESNIGHAGVAILLSGDGALARIEGFGTVTDEISVRWRRAEQQIVREFEPRLEAHAAYRDAVPSACSSALDAAGLGASEVAWLGIASPEARAGAMAQRKAGLDGAKAVNTLTGTIGYTGAPAALLTLAQVVEESEPAQALIVAAAGDGAGAVVLRRGTAGRNGALRHALARRRELTSYTQHLADRGLIARGPSEGLEVSPVAYWRVRDAVLRRRGARCGRCGVLEYPAGTACSNCGAVEGRTPERLGETGTVFTFTHDHLIGGRYSERPITRCVVEFEGGARLYTSLSDAEPGDVAVGIPVEMVLRRRGGLGFANYGWRARPIEVTGRCPD